MSSETRRITFSNEELIQAIAKQRRDEKQGLPESRIRGVKIEKGAETKILIVLAAAEGTGTETIEIRLAEIAAALIKFCGRKRIPLPKRANKSIGVENGQVSLMLHLSAH